jgi:hypothetical protein
MTLEKSCEYFIDWKKAFDHVDWTKLLEILIGGNIDSFTIYT